MDLNEKLKKFKIIDSHMHLGIMPNVLYYNYSDERVFELQKNFNVKVSICSHCISFYDLSLQIPEIMKVDDKFGPFFYWNLVYNPKIASKSLMIIEDNRAKINFAGIKIHPVLHETRIDSKLYEPLWEYASREDIVISSHTWSPYTDNPKQFNGNPCCLCNPEVINFVSNHENVYMDFSGDTIYPSVFKMVLDKAGKGRILFGTDMPMMDIRYHVASVLSADIEDSDREDIFYNTAAKLYNF